MCAYYTVIFAEQAYLRMPVAVGWGGLGWGTEVRLIGFCSRVEGSEWLNISGNYCPVRILSGDRVIRFKAAVITGKHYLRGHRNRAKFTCTAIPDT